jgi:hypothetical protein
MISLDNGNFVAVLPVPSLSGALQQRNILRKVAMIFWNTHREARNSTTSLVRRVLELREGGAGALKVPGRLGGREHFICCYTCKCWQRIGFIYGAEVQVETSHQSLSSCVSIMLFA